LTSITEAVHCTVANEEGDVYGQAISVSQKLIRVDVSFDDKDLGFGVITLEIRLHETV
jgi:hypothetical protein